MSTRSKFFAIPAKSPEEEEDAYNRFRSTVRVVNTYRQFVDQGHDSYWSLMVDYIPRKTPEAPAGKKQRVDYKEKLSAPDYLLYNKLRDWRKTTSEAEGIAIYNVFNNEQLADFSQQHCTSLADLKKIPGVGEGKLGKYGKDVLRIIADHDNEPPPGEDAAPDSQPLNSTPESSEQTARKTRAPAENPAAAPAGGPEK